MKKLAEALIRGAAWLAASQVPGLVATGVYAASSVMGVAIPALKNLAAILHVGGLPFGAILFGVEVVEYLKKGEE